jgi:hypothetical protein
MARTEWDGEERRDIRERVAVLEATVTEIKTNQASILEEVQGIRGDLSRYKGVLGGVLLVLSAIGFAIEVFGSYIKDHWR